MSEITNSTNPILKKQFEANKLVDSRFGRVLDHLSRISIAKIGEFWVYDLDGEICYDNRLNAILQYWEEEFKELAQKDEEVKKKGFWAFVKETLESSE